MVSSLQLRQFQDFVNYYYTHYGRHTLPWRTTTNPYAIMVSEIMLQQTQVDRVIPKFLKFLELFPTVEALAQASQAEVIKAWQGLGYNRRGLNLQRAAQAIVKNHAGKMPQTTPELLALPGIGPYTAAAIQTFAFNIPTTVIETNIRTVFIYHFFHGSYQVLDEDLLPLIAATIDTTNPRQWYSALMDYGTFLKQQVPNPTRQSKHYVKQSNFATSNRRVRGAVLQYITHNSSATIPELEQELGFSPERLQPALKPLVTEGFLRQQGEQYLLA